MDLERRTRTVQRRAKTVLGDLDRYHDLSKGEVDRANVFPGLVLLNDEAFIGWYDNDKCSMSHAIVFTTHGLHVLRGDQWAYVPYESIQKMDLPPQKLEAWSLKLELSKAGEVILPIGGGEGKHRDVYVVYRFLDKITRDLLKHELEGEKACREV